MPATSGVTTAHCPAWLVPSAQRPGSLGLDSVPFRQRGVHGDPVGERVSPKKSIVIQSPVRQGCSTAQRDNTHCRPDTARTVYRHPYPFARMSTAMDATKYSALQRA
eukprot:1055772-Rhodomonas_salina.1